MTELDGIDRGEEFEEVPIASASLAQVHVAYVNGKKLAVKVQHAGLKEMTRGDLMALEFVVRVLEYILGDKFKYACWWEELIPHIPKELDVYTCYSFHSSPVIFTKMMGTMS